jgi:hypothetical protein
LFRVGSLGVVLLGYQRTLDFWAAAMSTHTGGSRCPTGTSQDATFGGFPKRVDLLTLEGGGSEPAKGNVGSAADTECIPI